jgi:hypothetical protein
MEAFWQGVQTLSGQTLRTMKQAKPFEITDVTDDSVHMLVGKDRTPKSIIRGQFAEAKRKGLLRGDVTRTEIEEAGIAAGRTVYATAIIRAICE